MDNRVRLEIDSVTKHEDNWDLKFFYNSHDKQTLLKLVEPFNDLIVASKTFFMNNLEDIFYMRISPIKKENAKKYIEDILSSDNEALLQTQIDDETLQRLCMFKIKVMKEGVVGFHSLEEMYDE